MSFGLLGDFDAMDDIDVVKEGLEESLRELVGGRRRPAARRSGPRRDARQGADSRTYRVRRAPGIMGPMDPRRKRTIRLVIALSVAVLLGGALIYTSFSAATEARQPSELLAGATPGKSYELTGKVAARVRRAQVRRAAVPGARPQAAPPRCPCATRAPCPTRSARAAR